MSKIRVSQVEDIHTNETYLEKDLKVTTKVGEVKDYDTGKSYATISATKAGGAKKSVQEVLEEIFSKDANPTVTNPSLSMTVTPDNALAEVGETVVVRATVTGNPGAYSYGPATGVTFNSLKATLNNGKTELEEIEATSGVPRSFTQVTMTDGMDLKVSCFGKHSAGATPKTQLENDAPALAIAATELSIPGPVDKPAVKAYRKYFYGIVTNNNTLDSAAIRALTGSTSAAASGKTMNISAGSNATKRMVVAAPKDAVSGITALLTTSMNANISANFVKQTVQVAGANSATAIDYDVWVFQPDAFQGNEIVKVTLN